jgi:GDP-mannose 6-dehydrogenase
MEHFILPTLEHTIGEGPGPRWEVAYNPEFLRESTSVEDYYSPPKIVIGERRPGLTRQLLGLYAGIDAPLFEVSFAVAEFSKFMDNSWHALKVAFANEAGRIAAARGVDPQEAASLFLADTKLNISTYYLSPGGPYGGSCLPKDLSATVALARASGVEAPVLASIKDSNAAHLDWLVRAVQSRLSPPGAILLLGLSFKAGTDDLRNSPLLNLADKLIQHGYNLDIFDPDIGPNHLIGTNFAVAVEHHATLFKHLTQDVEAAMERCNLIIRGKLIPHIQQRLSSDIPLLDIHQLKGFKTQEVEVRVLPIEEGPPLG